jgi:hypothetical protein
MKKVSMYFDYIYSESRSGEITYLHSAPCLDINRPMQDYWTRKNNGEEPLHLGGVVWAATTQASKES